MLSPYEFFKEYPEFIEQDIRRFRTNGVRNSYYNVNEETMIRRISLMVDQNSVKNRTILDIGSCIGTLGAWCLEYGARHYTGIEIQPDFIRISETLLSKHFPNKFTIVNQPIQDFETTEKYDVVVAAGVMFSVFDVFEFCKKLVSLSKERIVIESLHPYDGMRMVLPHIDINQRRKVLEETAIIRINDNAGMTLANTPANISGIVGCEVSIGALDIIMRRLGWEQTDLYRYASKRFPEFYDCEHSNRYLVEYEFTGSTVKEFYKEFDKPDIKIKLWNGNSTTQ